MLFTLGKGMMKYQRAGLCAYKEVVGQLTARAEPRLDAALSRNAGASFATYC